MKFNALILLGLGFAFAAAQPAYAKLVLSKDDMTADCMSGATARGPADLPTPCAKLIAEAKTPQEKAIHYFSWAYALNEADNAIAALPNLDKALALDPEFVNALHERSYTRNELGFYALALEDSELDVSLDPDSPGAYQERAFALKHLGQFERELADRDRLISLTERTPQRVKARIEALMWLGRYDEAARENASLEAGDRESKTTSELQKRQLYRPEGDAVANCQMKDLNPGGDLDTLIQDCTWAFDRAKNDAVRADMLTMRSVAYRMNDRDIAAALEDLQIAAGVDAANPERHINYGFVLLQVRHSWAAKNSFSTALDLVGDNKTDRAMALAGRASAYLNLGDNANAFNDAKASFEVEPTLPALSVLGELASDRGDLESAKLYWMGAWHMGARDDDLREKLRKAGIFDPDKEPNT